MLLNWGDPDDPDHTVILNWITEFVATNGTIGQGELDLVLLNWGDSLEVASFLADYSGDSDVDFEDYLIATLNEFDLSILGNQYGEWFATNEHPEQGL